MVPPPYRHPLSPADGGYPGPVSSVLIMKNAPVVCFDEKPVQLISEKKTPLPVKPGHPVLYDYEYVREGTRNLFGFFEPKAGWRHIAVTDRRTKDDFCEQMRYLVEDRYPKARTIHVSPR